VTDIPQTIVECDSPECEEELNVLSTHLTVVVKPKREVLIVEDIPTDDPEEVPESRVYLGTCSGRAPAKGILRFHNFKCAMQWFQAREDLKPRLQLHKEDDIYVPEDNRTPEELVEAGEMSEATLAAIDREPAEGGEE
jgi:hypothetical protein